MLYKSLVLPHLEYCNVVWDSCSEYLKDMLQKLQNRACKIILRLGRYASTSAIHAELKLWKLKERRKFHTACITYRCKAQLVPQYLSNIYTTVTETHTHMTRNASNMNMYVTRNNTEMDKSIFGHRSVLWNTLPAHLKHCQSIPSFKRTYFTWRSNILNQNI